jgi:hypothetical protein
MRQLTVANVRFGSKPHTVTRIFGVRFTPKSCRDH